MGLALMMLDDTTAASTQLRRAVEADPSLSRSWTALGRAYDKEKRWDESAAAYDKALAASPDSPVIINNIGMSMMLQRRYPEAATQFEHALAKDPAMETARANLRIALAWQGKYDEALAGLEQAQRADALNNVGYVAMLRGDYQQAQRCFSQALETSATYHEGAARNLEALRQLVKSKNTAPQTADTPVP
jgi:Flp pilus assembly protein TadD